MATSTRRTMLRAAGMAGAALPFGLVGPRGFATSRLAASLDPIAAPPICHAAAQVPLTVVHGPRKNLRLTWNATAICTVGVPVAQTKGYFEKRNLDVELINFGGSTDQLLEAIATGKADAGVGMALRWLKPLEQGFDVRITTAIHGGCMRLLARQGQRHHQARGPQGQDRSASPTWPRRTRTSSRSGWRSSASIRSRTCEWKVFPADLLPVALQKGEVQAFSLGDPLGWVLRERDGLTEVATNLDRRIRPPRLLRAGRPRQPDPRRQARPPPRSPRRCWKRRSSCPPTPTRRRRSSRPTRRRRSPSSSPRCCAATRTTTIRWAPICARRSPLYVEELKAISVIKPEHQRGPLLRQGVRRCPQLDAERSPPRRDARQGWAAVHAGDQRAPASPSGRRRRRRRLPGSPPPR